MQTNNYNFQFLWVTAAFMKNPTYKKIFTQFIIFHNQKPAPAYKKKNSEVFGLHESNRYPKKVKIKVFFSTVQ